jgi:SsrA-binding protein
VRKILLHKAELKKLSSKIKDKGMTIIPHKLYFNERGFAKLEICLAQGKQEFDNRESIKERDSKTELDRARKAFKNKYEV